VRARAAVPDYEREEGLAARQLLLREELVGERGLPEIEEGFDLAGFA
jgi:hypothetical protein